MKQKDLVMIVSAAVGTATLTVFALWPGPMEAGPEQEVQAAKTVKPRLVTHGVEFTLAAAEGRTFQAGEEPVFELKAVNTTGQPANVPVRLAMTATSAADMLSRVPSMPASLWQQMQPMVLKPGETRVLTVAPKTKLPAKSFISVSLRDAPSVEKLPAAAAQAITVLPFQRLEGGITMLSFSTAAPAGQPTLASVR